MNAAHIHLILNHFPVIGTIIGIGILAFGLLLKNNTIKKVALILFIVTAILTIPVFLSGEDAEGIVENIEGVSETMMEEHEELAEKSIWLMGFLGIISFFNFYTMIKNISVSFTKKITVLTLLVSLVTFGFFVQVANLGGKIRHSEIRDLTKYQMEESKEEKDSKKYDDD